MKISIMGTGYVGLVTGACLAEKGHSVTCIDVDSKKVDRINRGESPIYETGLEALLTRNLGKRLSATVESIAAIKDSEMTMIAVGTPFDGERIDLSYIRACAQTIGNALKSKTGYHVVVVKSTVVPGTTDKVVLPTLEAASGKRAGIDFGVGMNPEFLTEGEAISDFMAPDRIVCGGIDDRTRDALEELYAGFPEVPKIRTNNSSAEMIKYASNALLANLISFSNEIANLGAALGGIDTVEVMQGLHLSRYLSLAGDQGGLRFPAINSFLMAGCGFGGSCLPKDVSALVAHGKSAGVPMDMLQASLTVNGRQPDEIFRLLAKHFPVLKERRITVLGLAFRPDTNDMRESPAIPVIRRLQKEGAIVTAFDPIASQEGKAIFGEGIKITDTLESAMQGAEAIILITRWKQFERLPSLLKAEANQPLVIDGRRMLDKNSVKRYEGIGL
ncbi:MAG: UDP-glucose/GDP-mannose dehydrogenase family protein [Fibrobacterota bacterium]|nr:UDP-glucose/GDP-mannose dehydrogenase family protein [Fibrobacterota bacterium]